jgi:hypothetical protein
MDPKDVWAKIPIHPSVKIAEEAFCRELLFIFPDLLEYCYSMEKIALESGKEISRLKHELNMLKEVPKKVRKPRAKKVKE